MKTLAGQDIQLSEYDGKVVVFVNVASKCGFTPQYEALQQLHEKYSDQGVMVVGVPCNQFGGQEPGSADDIAAFCQDTYGVEFDMLEKVDVKGNSQCELYKYLTSFDVKPAGKGPVKWNFEKFVVDRNGKAIARFGSRVSPTDAEFVKVIDSAIAKKSGNAKSSNGETTTSTGTGPYAHQSSKSGKTYYLFSKTVKLKNSDGTSTIYYFSSDPENPKGKPVSAVPEDRVVSETKTGMLVLKKK